MRITIMLLVGALLLAAVLWTARTTNRLYAEDSGSLFRGQPRPSSQILAGLDDTIHLESTQMSTIPAQPPIDSTVPAKLQVATFSLG